MKTVKIFIVFFAFIAIPKFVSAQQIALVEVGFQDGLLYHANEVNRTPTTLTVDFLQSGARYVFDNSGNILSSNGKYAAGGQVNLIVVSKYLRGIYHHQSLQSTDTSDPFEVGVVFGDGKLYYGVVESSAEAGWASVVFHHSSSRYTFHWEDGAWKVWSTDKGSYPKGHQLTDIFEVGEPDIYFTRL